MAKQQQAQASTAEQVVGKSEAFFEKHKKAIIIAVIAVVVVIAGVYSYCTLVVKPNREKAATALAKGQEYFSNGQWDIALQGDKMGYAGFLTLMKKYSGTPSANLAKLYAGLSYAQKGDAKNAIKYLEDFSSKGDHMVSPAALGALGNSYAANGQTDKAIATLKKAAKKADNSTLSPIFLIQAGQLLESQGKAADAKALYEQVKSKYPTAPEAQDIDKLILRVS